MAHVVEDDSLSELLRTPASEVKRQGWRGVMRTLSDHGRVLITNHDHPEAVILSVREYAAMVQAIQKAQTGTAATLDGLRQRFDERLAALDAPEAADRLRALIGTPVRTEGKVKAGTGY